MTLIEVLFFLALIGLGYFGASYGYSIYGVPGVIIGLVGGVGGPYLLLYVFEEITDYFHERKYPPLIKAIINKNKDKAENMILEGADVNVKTEDGTSALHFAVGIGELELVKHLIDKGAEVNSSNKTGNLPLYIAVEFGNVEEVELLLDEGADPNKITNNDYSILFSACKPGNIQILELLLSRSADPNVKNDKGILPLHKAAFDCDKDIVRLLASMTQDINTLIEKGHDNDVEPNWVKIIQAQKGDTPLDIAIKSGNREAVKVLRALGAKRGKYLNNQKANDASERA